MNHFTFRTSCKFLPKWGAVHRVVSRDRNSYKLATLEGLVLKGQFSARRLRRFMPREGTALAADQDALVAATNLLWHVAGLSDEEVEDVPEEGVEEADDQVDGGEVMEFGSEDDEEEDGEEVDKAESADDNTIDDGMALAGWGAPGRLRRRHSKQD